MHNKQKNQQVRFSSCLQQPSCCQKSLRPVPMAPIQNATQKMPNPTQGPMLPQNAEAGSCTHEISRVCLFPPWRTSPTKTSKFTFQAEVPGGRTSGVVGKTSKARWLVSYLGGHWMEDKWPDKKRRWFVTVVWYFSPNSQVLPPPPPPPFGQDGFST